MRRYMVKIERPPAEELAKYPRDERYDHLRHAAEHIRVTLLEWVEAHGIGNEVARIERATVFDLLFMVATPHAAMLVREAPAVIAIAPADSDTLDVFGADDDATFPLQAP
jgi:hypothetical protein